MMDLVLETKEIDYDSICYITDELHQHLSYSILLSSLKLVWIK